MAEPHHSTLPEISREELLARLRDPGLIVVDTLPRVSYESAHIAGAINLPLLEVSERAAMLLPQRDAEIALYCYAPT